MQVLVHTSLTRGRQPTQLLPRTRRSATALEVRTSRVLNMSGLIVVPHGDRCMHAICKAVEPRAMDGGMQGRSKRKRAEHDYSVFQYARAADSNSLQRCQPGDVDAVHGSLSGATKTGTRHTTRHTKLARAH
jgi:hypothetical protein